jgi:hypothetical protein
MELLIAELTRRFPDCEIMEALGIVFPQYWLQAHCDKLFPHHLVIIKQWYYGLREVQGGFGDSACCRQIVQLLNSYKLDL